MQLPFFHKKCKYILISDITAAICGVPPQLVKNLHVIWGTLASGYAIDSTKFQDLCKKTLDIYFDDQIGVSWCQFHLNTFWEFVLKKLDYLMNRFAVFFISCFFKRLSIM